MAAVGEGIFETLKVVDSRPLDLERHLERLVRSADRLGLPRPDAAVIRERLELHLGTDPASVLRMRITWFATDDGAELSVDSAPIAAPSASVRLALSSWRLDPAWPLAGLKTTAYLDHSVALQGARGAGFDDALIATTSGLLCETSTANLFYVLDGVLRTPTLATGCLPGIARARILEICDVVAADAPVSALSRATEVFVTSSLRGVQPVARVDGTTYPAPGPITAEVIAQWEAHGPR